MSKHVLFVVHHPMDRDAGVAGATTQLAAALTGKGWRVSFFSFDEAFGKAPGNEVARMLAFPFAVARYLWRNSRQFDVVDATTGDTWLWLALGRPGGAHLRVVTHSHGLEQVAHRARQRRERLGELSLSWKYPLYHGGWRLREVDITLRDADGTVYVSAADREWAIRELHVDASRAVAIPNALPDPFLRLPAPIPRAAGKPLSVVVLGAWVDRKGSKSVVAAARELHARGIAVRWSLLGTQRDEGLVAAEFPEGVRASLEISKSYSRADLPRLLADSQVFLLPSWSEGFNMSLVEAMACGLAPVATDVGDARLFVGPDTGVLVPEGAAPAIIADAIASLDRSPELESRRKAAQVAVQDLSWPAMADRAIAFYESLGTK